MAATGGAPSHEKEPSRLARWLSGIACLACALEPLNQTPRRYATSAVGVGNGDSTYGFLYLTGRTLLLSNL